MIRALVEKELRQHAVTFAFLFALLLVGLAGINGNQILITISGTGLAGMGLFLWTIVPLACLMFGHVLIAAEFSQKTQLFLEGLPLPRWRFLAVKYLLGLLVLAAGCAAALTIAFQSEVTTGAITLRFVLIVVSKTVVWLLFVYTVFFTHSLLGRYRFPTVIAVALLVSLLGLIGTRWWKWAPFTLVDIRFPFEAHHYPMTELWITVGASVALLVASFWLGLARDATLTFSLARKMSASERSIVTFLTIAAVVSLMFVFNKQREEKEVVRMPGAVELERGQIRVSASAAVSSPTSAEQAAVQDIVPRLVAELASVAEYLGCKTMPTVFIVHRRDFAAGQLENGGLKPQQGLMVRVNLAPESFKEKEFLEGVIYECLSLKSSGRAKMERNVWVLTGFAQWWTLRKEQTSKNAATISDGDLKRFEEEKIVISEQSLDRWFTLTQKLSEEQREALACVGINVLETRHSEEACRRFLSAMLSRDLPHDVRGWLYDVFNPLSRRFRKATGASLQSFASEWDKALQAQKIAKAQEK